MISSSSSLRRTNLEDSCPGAPRVCGYCQETKPEDDKLVKPCSCKGKLRFGHISCLKFFLENKILKSPSQEKDYILQNKRIKCEMCKSFISFELQIQKRCANCEESRRNFYSRSCSFNAFIIFLLAVFVVLIGTCAGLLPNESKESSRVVLIIFLSLFCLGTVIVVGVMVRIYGVTTSYKVKEVKTSSLSKKVFSSESLNPILSQSTNNK